MKRTLLLLCLLLSACQGQAPAEPVGVVREPSVLDQAALPPTPTPGAPATLAPTPAAPPEPTAVPTQTPAPTPTVPARPRVGIQAGHWQTDQLPEELARFRTSTGAFVAGYSEIDVNLPIAEQVVVLLQANGVDADLLPATVPVAYAADAFVALHADGSPQSSTRGFKLATPWRTSAASQLLLEQIDAAYAEQTGLPRDGAVTFNMRGYYAFSWRRHQHAVARTTPAVIVEMGYLSNPTDRAMLLEQPDLVAQAITTGILNYLARHDPADRAALEPPDLALQRPRESGVPVHAAPQADSAVLAEITPEDRFMPFREQDGWYEGVVRNQWRVVGWVRREQLAATNEPFPTPAPLDR